MKVAFRADDAPGAGSGHVMRCRSLAQALEQRGARTTFDSAEPADWLVVDHYGLDAGWEAQARRSGQKVLAIDDLGRAHDCDLLLDQNYFPEADKRYAGRLPERSRHAFGPRYALLRPEFDIAPRERDGRVKRVLVSMGGLDAGNETAKAIQLLAGKGFHVDVVVGAASPHRASLQVECMRARFAFHMQIANIAALMNAADFSIGAGGTTTWERCSLGLPTLQVAIADNQVEPSRALGEAGIVTYAGRSLTEESLRKALADPETLLEQSRRMRWLVDSHGARRVAAAMLASRDMPLKMRKASSALHDVRMYFDWANDAEVRRQSFDSRPIERQDHIAWFGRRLADSLLLVAEDEAGVPVGQVRFQRGEAWRVNYSMAAEFRGLGLGARMMAMAIQELRQREPGAKLQAQVKADNTASRQVFVGLGFRQTSETQFEL